MSTSRGVPVRAFAETAALYAVMTDDDTSARRIVGDMLPGERAEFAAQLDRLRAMLTDRFDSDIPSHVRVLDDEGRFLHARNSKEDHR